MLTCRCVAVLKRPGNAERHRQAERDANTTQELDDQSIVHGISFQGREVTS